MSSPVDATSPISLPAQFVAPTPARAATFGEVNSLLNRIFTALRSIAHRVAHIALVDGTRAFVAELHGSKAGDLDATYITVVSPRTPDEEFEVPHFLGRVPIGFETCGVYGKAGVFYTAGQIGAPGWSDRTIKLKCNASEATAVLRVF